MAVIGAGIMGTSVAYHLARRGAAVTLIDRGQPAGECTAHSFAWIGPGDVSAPFGSKMLEEYYRIERELAPALRIDWSGSLVWGADAAETERDAAERAAAGFDLRLVERTEIARLEPNLREPPDLAVFETAAGAFDPVATTQVFVDAALESGARALFNAEPVSIVTSDHRVTGVRIGNKVIDADVVVLATGVGTNGLLEPLGMTLPIESSPALIVRLKTPRALVSRVLASPSREVRQVTEGVMLSPGGGSELADGPEVAAERVLQDVRRFLKGAEAVTIESAGIGLRPMPADGVPIIGFMPGIEGLYLTVVHPGVNLAPMVGRMAAVEVVDGVSVNLLDVCRPARF